MTTFCTWQFCLCHPLDCSISPIYLETYPCLQRALFVIRRNRQTIVIVLVDLQLTSSFECVANYCTQLRSLITPANEKQLAKSTKPVLTDGHLARFARTVIRVSVLRWACVSKIK